MTLPKGSQFFLERDKFVKSGQILKFVQANNKLHLLFLSNGFGQVKHFVAVFFQVLPNETKVKIGGGVGAKGKGGDKFFEKSAAADDPLLPLGRGGFNHFLGEDFQKSLFIACPKQVEYNRFAAFLLLINV